MCFRASGLTEFQENGLCVKFFLGATFQYYIYPTLQICNHNHVIYARGIVSYNATRLLESVLLFSSPAAGGTDKSYHQLKS